MLAVSADLLDGAVRLWGLRIESVAGTQFRVVPLRMHLPTPSTIAAARGGLQVKLQCSRAVLGGLVIVYLSWQLHGCTV